MKWTETFRINSHDCDRIGRVRPSLILRYMQETANLQLRAMGLTHDKLAEKDMAFILSRISIRAYAELYAYDDVCVSTWSAASRGVSLNRSYEIRRGNELIAEADSVWGLIGISDKKIYKPSEIPLPMNDDESEVSAPSRIRIPKELPLALVGERNVVYSDIDLNNHMNNTNYPDMLCDFIPDMADKQLHAINIGFMSEARLGETLKVYMAKQGNEYYFRSVRQDGNTNVEATIQVDE